jgi:two-component sensor histidine kinase
MFIALATGISMHQFDRSTGRSARTFTEEFTLPLVNGLIYALLTPFVFGIALRHPIQRDNWPRHAGLYLAGSLLFAGAHVILRGLTYPVWDPRINAFAYALRNPYTHAFQVQWILFDRLLLYNVIDDIFSDYFPIVLIAHAVWYYQRFRDRELRASQLEGQLSKAHLQALKSQLQPHFLFNTMHSISALMLTDVRAADKMMTRLSDLLRMTLENDGVQVTTLSREIEFVTGYLEIERVRFEDRLAVRFDINPDTLDAQVPYLLLQPLVENSVHHGISRRSSGGEIRIAANHEGGSLHLSVQDNGPGLHVPPNVTDKTGLGLKATRERLHTLYGSQQSLDIRSLAEGGVEVVVRIPFLVLLRPLAHEGVPQGPSPAD